MIAFIGHIVVFFFVVFFLVSSLMILQMLFSKMVFCDMNSNDSLHCFSGNTVCLFIES